MGKVTVICFLVLVGAVIGNRDLDLWNAAKNGNLADVESALASGADPNWGNNVMSPGGMIAGEYKPLHWAVVNNLPAMVKVLLDAGADIEGRGVDGSTPLWLASVVAGTDTVKMLISRGADIDSQVNDGTTPLIIAINNAMRNEFLNTVKALLNGNPNVRLSDHTGSTALHYTAQKGVEFFVDIARLLLQNGADIEHKNNQGRTALHEAAYWNRTGIALLLMQEGANTRQQDNEGKTPIDIARERGHHQLANILDSTNAASDLYLLACGVLAMFIGETLSYVLH